MGESARKKLTFDGFLMEMGEAGTKDSEGVFTLAAEKTVERLKEQYAADPLLGYTEILQGFQQTGALHVELHGSQGGAFTLSALYSEAPQLEAVLKEPLSILSTSNCLQSGSGLLLLQEPRLSWSLTEARRRRSWVFNPESGSFEAVSELEWTVPTPTKYKLGGVWLQLHIRSEDTLPVYTWDTLQQWRETPLTRELTNRLAFYALPLTFQNKNLQCPLPGRLVPTDYWCRSPVGGMGYSWVPLAYQYVAAEKNCPHSFLSEPFTGLIARKVKMGESTLSGYSSASKPDFVSLRGNKNVTTASTVPFKRSWWHKSEPLAVPGFQRFPESIMNPRLEPPLFRSHPRGNPLVCSRIMMLSTALKGLSTLVFLKHGVVLGARHEDLGQGGSLCLVGTDDLSTDLSRRRVRADARYEALVARLRKEMALFYNEAAHVLGF